MTLVALGKESEACGVYNPGVARNLLPMPSPDFDVFVCCREPEGLDVARTLTAGLRALGFHVFFEPRGNGPGGEARRLAMEDAHDFVLIVTPGALRDVGAPDDPVRQEIAAAVRMNRVIVPVCLPGVRVPVAAELPEDIAAISAQPVTAYDPARVKTSVALVSHSLSSDATIEDRKLERRARVVAWFVGLVFTGVVAYFVVPPIYRLVAAPAAKQAVPPFVVSWAAVARHEDTGGVADLAAGQSVSGRERIKVWFSPSADGFAYVFARNARGEVSVLFPRHALRGAAGVKAGQVYEAPAADRWFEPAGGAQTIFVVAGYDSLENFEELAEDQDNTTRASERRELLEDTWAGLVDGRHGATPRTPRTRTGNPVDSQLSPTAPAATLRHTLGDGTVIARPLTTQRGIISAAVEIRLAGAQRQ
jgi:hypothetical protein